MIKIVASMFIITLNNYNIKFIHFKIKKKASSSEEHETAEHNTTTAIIKLKAVIFFIFLKYNNIIDKGRRIKKLSVSFCLCGIPFIVKDFLANRFKVN